MDESAAIERLKGGDVGGLEPLVRAHHARAVRAAYLVVRDRALAEDVAQSAFVKACEKIAGFEEGRPFEPWFMRLVVNDAVKAAKKHGRAVRMEVADAEEMLVRLADPGTGPQEEAEKAEARRRVWEALEQLPPTQRAAIVQRYYLGMTEAEMAEHGATASGTIKSRLHNARKVLARLLSPQFREGRVVDPETSSAPGRARGILRRGGEIMTDRREHLREALRGCAEAGVPVPKDPWPAVGERTRERLGRRAIGGQSRRRPRLLPSRRAGLILAALSVLLFGTAAYAVSGLTRSGLTIEEAALRSGERGDEIVVRVRATGSANLPECFLVEGPTMEAFRRFEDGGEPPPQGRLESPWPADGLTESRQVDDTTVFIFRRGKDPENSAADPRRTPFFAVCSAGTQPGGSGPGVRRDEAHVAGTPEGAVPPPPEEREKFVRKDMASQQIMPPMATLSSGGASVEGAAGPYCWSPGRKSEEENVLWCWNEAGVEGQVPPEKDTLSVSPGSTMVLGFDDRPRLDAVLVDAVPLVYGEMATGQPGKALHTARQDGRIEVPVDLPAGEHFVFVHVNGPEGEADYAFRIAVERAPGSRSSG